MAGHVLQLAQVRHLEAGLVLGQDLHEGPQLQPPLLAGDSVPVDQMGGCGRVRPAPTELDRARVRVPAARPVSTRLLSSTLVPLKH